MCLTVSQGRSLPETKPSKERNIPGVRTRQGESEIMKRADTAMSSETTLSEEEYVDKVQLKALSEEIRRLQKKQQFFENEEQIAALQKRVDKLKLKTSQNGESATSQRV